MGDVAIRYDGQMFSFSQGFLGQQSVDANVGNFLQIDTGTAAAVNVNDDDIETYVPDADGNAVRAGFNQQGVGVFFDAIAFRGDQQYDLYAVGRRGECAQRSRRPRYECPLPVRYSDGYCQQYLSGPNGQRGVGRCRYAESRTRADHDAGVRDHHS